MRKIKIALGPNEKKAVASAYQKNVDVIDNSDNGTTKLRDAAD